MLLRSCQNVGGNTQCQTLSYRVALNVSNFLFSFYDNLALKSERDLSQFALTVRLKVLEVYTIVKTDWSWRKKQTHDEPAFTFHLPVVQIQRERLLSLVCHRHVHTAYMRTNHACVTQVCWDPRMLCCRACHAEPHSRMTPLSPQVWHEIRYL